MKVGLPTMKNVLTLLAKCVLIPLALTTSALAADGGAFSRGMLSQVLTLTHVKKRLEL